MKHIVVIEDNNSQSKAFLEIAKALKQVKIYTTKQWEKLEDNYTAAEIKKGLNTPLVKREEVSKALAKMRK